MASSLSSSGEYEPKMLESFWMKKGQSLGKSGVWYRLGLLIKGLK